MAPSPDLSTRQQEVLRLIEQGHSYSEVGRELGIGSSTIALHVAKIRAKGVAVNTRPPGKRTTYPINADLNLDERMQLEQLASRHGLSRQVLVTRILRAYLKHEVQRAKQQESA